MPKFYLSIVLLALADAISAQDVIELETTTIKGNTELPKYMYVVPWQDSKSKTESDRKLKLPNLYGDLFDPVMPEQPELTSAAVEIPSPIE